MKKTTRVMMVAASEGSYGGMEVHTTATEQDAIASGNCEVQVMWRVLSMLDFLYLRDLLWADVVHCHFPLIYATYPARLLGKKLIITGANLNPWNGIQLSRMVRQLPQPIRVFPSSMGFFRRKLLGLWKKLFRLVG